MALNEILLILCIGIVSGLLLGMVARWLGRKLIGEKRKAILVICAWCGNEMRRSGISDEVIVSHGICPKCQTKHFPKTKVGVSGETKNYSL